MSKTNEMSNKSNILIKFLKWCDSLCYRMRNSAEVIRISGEAHQEEIQRLDRQVEQIRRILASLESEEENIINQLVSAESSIERFMSSKNEITPELSHALFEYTSVRKEKKRVNDELTHLNALYSELQVKASILKQRSLNIGFYDERENEVAECTMWSEKDAQSALKFFLESKKNV